MSKYPLEQVLFIKKKRLDDAERILKEKKEILTKEEQKLALCQKEYDEQKLIKDTKLQQLRATMDEETTSDKVQTMKQYIKVVDEKLAQKDFKLKEQKKVVDNAKKQVEIARTDYIEKENDVEKIRQHKEEWSKEVSKEALRVEANESDEIGTSSYVRKSSKKHS